ncbi:MAG: enoyl-CoA hydratase-related protein [Pseudomonadota bacterium]
MGNQTKELNFENKGCIGILEINRPGKKNAVNDLCWKQLEAILDDLEPRGVTRALIITGSGSEIFSAGVDVNPSDPLIAAMFQAIQSRESGVVEDNLARIHALLSRLSNLPVPTIAAFNGDAYSGGLELSLACDIRVARQGAFMAFQETRLGLIPDLGGTIRLSRLLGPGKAKDLIYSCRKISAHEAHAMGLIQHVFPDDDFMDHVLDYAQTLTANSPEAIAAVKTIIDTTWDMDMDQALAVERNRAARTIVTGQCIEGVGAFFENRTPVWP